MSEKEREGKECEDLKKKGWRKERLKIEVKRKEIKRVGRCKVTLRGRKS